MPRLTLTEDAFYRARDARSTSYLHEAILAPRPVQVVWDRAAAMSPAGQLLILGLANQLARFVRTARFDGPDAELLAPALVQAGSLKEAIFTGASSIDPFGGWTASATDAVYTIAVGAGDGRPCNTYLYGSRWVGYAFDAARDCRTDCPLGAAIASCIGAANAFKASLGLAQAHFNGSLSLWNHGRNAAAEKGPAISGELNLGNVLMVGAGAVASALAYWLLALPVRALWDIVDRDCVDITNINRGMLFTAAQAGCYGDPPALKALVLAERLHNATAHDNWFDEFQPLSSRRWDLYLPLANDRDARHLVQAEYPPVMLHATTSENWESQLHRHRPGVDRCISCRFPGNTPPPKCSQAHVVLANQTTDAALPFLSAGAGALLAADLVRLAMGHLGEPESNYIVLDWHSESSSNMMRAEDCDLGCQHWGSPAVRRHLNCTSRWFTLDRQAHQARSCDLP